jgi:hypothetical protein
LHGDQWLLCETDLSWRAPETSADDSPSGGNFEVFFERSIALIQPGIRLEGARPRVTA